MDMRVTPTKPVTSPTWGPPPPCKRALKQKNCSMCSLLSLKMIYFILFPQASESRLNFYISKWAICTMAYLLL